MHHEDKAFLGVIGGSGLYKIFDDVEELDIDTPFGKPSSKIFLKSGVAFISRHGVDHSIPPHLVNYRANVYALYKIGVRKLISIGATGGINTLFKSGDIVITSDVLDFTKSRASTFFEGIFSKDIEEEDTPFYRLLKAKKVVHTDMSNIFCEEMIGIASDVFKELKIHFYLKGVYACTEGPRFETKKEIEFLRHTGADMVGMTACPELFLARETGMHILHISVITNPAAGIEGHKLTSKEVLQMMKQKDEEIKKFLTLFIPKAQKQFVCQCENVLEGADV
ncbi:MTAP family purine nucleoside phosphorylase [Hydrogenobaculum acidophilum]